MATEREKEKAFAKTDMERVGLFQEMGYICVGDKYKAASSIAFNDTAGGGKQMLPGGRKSKSALPSGYFSDKFSRVLDGESYSDPVKMRRQDRLKEAQKNIGKPFVPSSGEKKMSGIGSYYGTLSGPVPALSPQMKPPKEYKAPGKNFYTSPGKKGTGYGFVHVTLGRYHESVSGDKYNCYHDSVRRENEAHRKLTKGGAFRLNMAPRDFFDDNPYKNDKPLPPARKSAEKKLDLKPFKPSSPSKMDGGMKAGTFETYPSHSADPYHGGMYGSRDLSAASRAGKYFIPPPGPKSAPSTSVLDQNIVRATNVQNFRTVHSVISY